MNILKCSGNTTNKRARVLHHHPETKLAEQTYNKSVQPKKPSNI